MITIRDISGKVRYSTPANVGIKRKFYLMKEDYVTLKFSVEHPVYFQLGDYCDIDEGIFEVVDLVYPSRNNATGGYDYELRLDAPYWKWKHKILFYDRQGNKEAAWSLTRNPEAHMSVVASNIAALGYTCSGEAYEFSIDYNVVEDKPIFLQYDNTNIIDAITMIAEACECEWWVSGKMICLGKCELPDEPLTFELWENVREMSRDKGDSTYATRIYAFGSTRNITPYYRKDLVFNVTEATSGGGLYVKDSGKPLKPGYFLDSRLVPFSKTVEDEHRITTIGELEQGGSARAATFSCAFGELPAGVYKMNFSGVKLNTYYGGSGTPRIRIRTTVACRYTSSGGQMQVLEDITSEWDFPRSSDYAPSLKSYEFDTGKYDLSDVSFSVTQEITVLESADILVFKTESSGKVVVDSGYDQYGVSVAFDTGRSAGNSYPATFNPFGRKDADPDFQLIKLDSSVQAVPGDRFRIIGLKYDRLPSGWFTSDHSDSDLVVEGVVEKRLMLPAGTPFIGDKDLPAEQVIEQVVVFEDIYPKRVGNVGTVTSHEYTDETKDDNGHVVSEEKWDAYRITDSDGNFHFSKDYLIRGKDLQITFQTGALSGMRFKVWFNPYDDKSSDKKQDEKNPDGTWNAAAQVFEIVRNEDYGMKLPAGDMKPRGVEYGTGGNVTYAGDEYILEGYDTQFVSDSLVPLAEDELKDKAQKYADKLKTDPSVYNSKMYSYEDGRYADLPVGRKVNLVNDTYFKNGRQSRIIGFEKNLDIPYDSPTYMVGESQIYSRIGALEGKVDSLTYNGASYTPKAASAGGGNIYVVKRYDNTQASDNNVYSALRSSVEFLSKKTPDTATGLITFAKGILANALSKFMEGIYVEGGADFDYAHVAETLSARLVDAVSVATGGLTATEAKINILDVLDRFATKDGKFSGKLYSADYVQAMIGWIINADGTAEMKGLRLREFLEVPELRYNRISVITGEQWSAPGGGTIESVDTDNRIIYLKLEPGELAAVEIDDICKGTFNNDTGFQTSFFRITEKLGDSTFKYVLRSGYSYHPQKAMHFVAYGNFTDKDRQASAYTTLKYTRYLSGVNTWEMSKDMVMMQLGDLSNLMLYGIDMTGYSAYLNRIYMTGTIKQLSSDGVTETPVPAFKGEWQAGSYYPNDEVTHEGSTWLCISETPTTQEPSEGASDWLERSAKGKDAVVVEIFSSNGNIFRNGEGTTTLTVQVRKGERDMTEGIPPERFSWEKHSANSDTDTVFNETHVGYGPTLEVTTDDVFSRATFNCIVNL